MDVSKAMLCIAFVLTRMDDSWDGLLNLHEDESGDYNTSMMDIN